MFCLKLHTNCLRHTVLLRAWWIGKGVEGSGVGEWILMYYPSFFLSLSLVPLTRELAPILEHRADYSVPWSFTGGRAPWTGDLLVARPLPKHRTTQTQNNADTLRIHAQGWIRTRNHGLRAIEDCSWLRPLGYRDRRTIPSISMQNVKNPQIIWSKQPAFKLRKDLGGGELPNHPNKTFTRM
jgi:hypothetical protein